MSLLAKWLPSVNASNADTVRMTKRIARSLGLDDAAYRNSVLEFISRGVVKPLVEPRP